MTDSELIINTLLRYTDEELVEHMRKVPWSDGSFGLDKEDLRHILTSEERERLAERVK